MFNKIRKFGRGLFSTPAVMPKDQPLSLNNGEQGATAIEYGLIAALIAIAAITAMQGLGNESSTANDGAPVEQTN